MVTVAIMAVCMSGSCYIISYTSCEVAHSREKQLAAFFFFISFIHVFFLFPFCRLVRYLLCVKSGCLLIDDGVENDHGCAFNCWSIQ